MVTVKVDPITQKKKSPSAFLTSRLAIFFRDKENRLSIFGCVIDYTDTHSFIVFSLIRNVLILA
jgi:hypothetical protein